MHRVPLLVTLHCLLWIGSNAAPITAPLAFLDATAVNILQTNCQTKKGGCNSQSEKAKRNRAAVKESLTRNYGKGHMPGVSSDQAEALLRGTQEIKLTIHEINKLTGILPHDNGLIQRDRVIKSLKEINDTLARLKGVLKPGNLDLSNPSKVVPLVGDVLGRKKRASGLALDYYRGNRWPSNTINVFIDSNIWSKSEADELRKCVKEISDKSGCLKFVESTQDPKVEFVKVPQGTDEGTCGWSSVGYQKGQRNDICLNFASSICRPSIRSVCVHETLHAIGLSHEHTRYDRDKYIKVNYDNVDPQSVSDFDKESPDDYNPLGKIYDLLSIMHYDVYVGAKDSRKQTMTPIQRPDLASQVGNVQSMSDSDALFTKRDYCTAANCRDAGSRCGWKATEGQCSSVSSSCPKSCGVCDKTMG